MPQEQTAEQLIDEAIAALEELKVQLRTLDISERAKRTVVRGKLHNLGDIYAARDSPEMRLMGGDRIYEVED